MDFEQLLVMLEKAESCSPRLEATPTPMLGPMSQRTTIFSKIEITAPLNPLFDIGLKNWLNWLLLHFSLVLEILLPFKRL